MEAPAVTIDPDTSITQPASALTDDVNAFLHTLPLGAVRAIDRAVTPVGKYGSHLLISVLVTYVQ